MSSASSEATRPPRKSIRRLIQTAFVRFIRAEAASGIVLIINTLLALGLANSRFGEAVSAFWQTTPTLPWLGVSVRLSLRDVIGDGLMAVFFLVVGLEIKRELIAGELASVRRAALPVLAALGGMLVPALCYLAFTSGTPLARGFGIPTATDIAFTVGVMTLLGKRVPIGAKVFITALAIADDLGAVVVIAIFYSQLGSLISMLPVVGLSLLLLVLNLLGVRRLVIFLPIGGLLWWAMHHAGVHATLAGVVLAMAIPLRAETDEQRVQQSPLHRLEQKLHLVVAFGILPLFALANAGVTLPAPADMWESFRSQPVTIGVFVGLLIGKPVGIFCASVLAIRLRIGAMPSLTSYGVLFGSSMLAGIGFTMSIFITGLAFSSPPQVTAAKIGVLSGSLCAALAGSLWLRFVSAPASGHGDPAETEDGKRAD